MPSAADRLDFGAHADPGSVRAFTLAVLVHLLLAAALTWGVRWTSSTPDVSFDAELWSSLPQQAAPAPVEAAPPPPPPPPAPSPRVEAAKPAPLTPDVEIALEREKRRKQQKEAEDKKKALELAQKTEKADKARRAEEAAQAQAKLTAEAKKLEAKKLENEKEQIAKKQAAASAAVQSKRHKEAVDRMMGQAGATGGAEATGSAQRSSGPSASYGGKVAAKVKPNVIFTDDISGNPEAVVEVRTTADGSIIGQRLIKSSGNRAWDDAVIKAIIRTETLPRDVDGRVPASLTIAFRPKDL